MLERIRILVVDDDPYNVDILEQELGHLGYETVSANDGAEALKQVADSAPDLIILDIMMPVMDGFAVCPDPQGGRQHAPDADHHHDRAGRHRGSG